MVQQNKFFKAFLLVYLLFLLYHASHLEWKSWLAILGLISGITLAIVAHMRRGYGTLILLTIHMTIEWSEYAKHGTRYSGREILFYGTHTILDFTFLWHEVRTHLTKFRYIIMGSIAIGLITLFLCINHTEPQPNGFGIIEGYKNMQGSNIIEAVVIGGILGCTLSHLFARKKKELGLKTYR